MTKPRLAPLSGRRAQASRNDRVILEAARAVFVADPSAPIAAVAKRAGVGMSALYSRYASKEELIRKLCADGLDGYIAAVEAALADRGDPWTAFARFMQRIVDANVHALTLRVAGTFTPSKELGRRAAHAQELNVRLLDRSQKAGVVRRDLVVDDLTFFFEQLAAVHAGNAERTLQLRHRYLALHLEAIRRQSNVLLPGPPPRWEEIRDRWQR